MAEFAANNQTSASTEVSSFLANHAYHPQMDLNLHHNPQQSQELDGNKMAIQMKELKEYLKVQIQEARDKYEESTKRNRTPAPDFKVGDLVFLSAKNLRTTQNSGKLQWKQMGPFVNKRIISPYAYELDLPDTMKIHPAGHVSLLELAPTDPFEGQFIPAPPQIVIQEMKEYAVEKILDSRVHWWEPQYLVRWVRYPHPS
jgi:hypothetical protein